MEALYLLIPLGVVIIIAATGLFLRMASQGQFDDLDSPGRQVLLDDDRCVANVTPPTDSAPLN